MGRVPEEAGLGATRGLERCVVAALYPLGPELTSRRWWRKVARTWAPPAARGWCLRAGRLGGLVQGHQKVLADAAADVVDAREELREEGVQSLLEDLLDGVVL